MKDRNDLIFISYSHRNRPECETIASMLKENSSLDVWFDDGLIPGDDFRKKIVDIIKKSDYVIVLLSHFVNLSEWVTDEVEYAKRHHKRLLPIFLEDFQMPDALDMTLQRYHSLFWHLRISDQQFKEILLKTFQEPQTDNQTAHQPNNYGNLEFSEAEKTQIQNLLSCEKRGVFSQCYTAQGACLLGRAYYLGGYCPIDLEKAAFYFRIAEYRGNQDGRLFLLQLKLEQIEHDTWEEPDSTFCAPIIQEIQLIAENGSENAKMFLANLYWYGKYGCKKDLVRSAALYEECAKNGNARAQFMMASNYYFGDGVPKDYTLAVMYVNLSMEQNYIKSWRRWGEFYEDGAVVPQDYSKAKACYEKGAQLGDFNCYNKIGNLFYYGKGCSVDYASAFQFYQKAEQAPENMQKYGLRQAKHALGRCYELGNGVDQNIETAVQKYLEGYHYGSKECKIDYLRCAGLLKQKH